MQLSLTSQPKSGSFQVKPTIKPKIKSSINSAIKPTSDAFKSLKYYIPTSTRAEKEQSNFTIGSKSNLKDQYKTTSNSSVGNLPEIEHNFINRLPNVDKREQLYKFSKELSWT